MVAAWVLLGKLSQGQARESVFPKGDSPVLIPDGWRPRPGFGPPTKLGPFPQCYGGARTKSALTKGSRAGQVVVCQTLPRWHIRCSRACAVGEGL